MTQEETRELYKNICNDINCGTFILAPQYVDELLAKYIDSYKSEELGECRRCIYTDSPCVLSDYGKDKNGICDHFKNVFDENAELREKLERAERARDYWKSSSFDWRRKCTSSKPFKVAVKAQNQLTKAKEIIKTFLGFAEAFSYSPSMDKFITEAEQFLKEE